MIQTKQSAGTLWNIDWSQVPLPTFPNADSRMDVDQPKGDKHIKPVSAYTSPQKHTSFHATPDQHGIGDRLSAKKKYASICNASDRFIDHTFLVRQSPKVKNQPT